MKRQAISKRLNEFIKENGFGHPTNYMGPDFSNYVILVGSNRDADTLTRSNYQVACDMFPQDEDENILHISQGHWLCGWIELLLINFEGYQSNLKKRLTLYKAMKTKEALEDYPVLDDSHFCELEHTEAQELYDSEKEYWMRNLCEFLGLEKENLPVKLSNSLYKIILYTFEADCYHCGHDDGYFVADKEHLERGIEYIKDNQIMDKNEGLSIVREFLKEAA